MNLTPLGALELLLFEAHICNDTADLESLLERVRVCCRALNIRTPTLQHYDALRAGLREKLASQKARVA